jgi:1-acyl-sn-glycerol-3-phosphate acyltransferase
VSLLWRRVWSGQEHLPAGGVVLAANHLSVLDPVAVAHHLLRDLDRAPRFLVKSELFRGSGLVARVLCGAGQIPVERDTAEASKALDAAVAALGRGETVVIYPEGTVTRIPGTGRWRPHRGGPDGAAVRGAGAAAGRSGAARTRCAPCCGPSPGARRPSGSGRRSTCPPSPAGR